MAAGQIAAPGAAAGPCVQDCEHRDCALTRAMAESICRLCGDAIGYDTRFYEEDPGGYVHALCYEESLIAAGSKPKGGK